MTGPRILVIDGNVAEIRARQLAALGYDSGTGYARVLRRIDASLQIDIVLAADGDVELPAGVALENYDGVTMTGSALNIYNGGAAGDAPDRTRQGGICRWRAVLRQLLGTAGCGDRRGRRGARQSARP